MLKHSAVPVFTDYCLRLVDVKILSFAFDFLPRQPPQNYNSLLIHLKVMYIWKYVSRKHLQSARQRWKNETTQMHKLIE